MPPLKKGAYCFATVGRSVCRSVDQVLSDQYLLTPSLDQYQTWCRGFPQWVDVRSHVQRSRSNHSSKPSVLSGQYLLTPSLDQYQTWFRGCPQWVHIPYWFWGHMLKGQGQATLDSPLCCPLNFFWTLYLINTKLGMGLPSMSRWSLFIFRSHVQRSRSNHSSKPSVLYGQYLLTPSLDQYQTWCRGCTQ